MTRPFPRPLPPPWDRIFPLVTQTFVWALLFGIVYLLRSFFLLIFLTFVFAYVQAHGVDRLAKIIRNRPIRVVLVALVFLGAIVGIGFWMFPHIKEQAGRIGGNYDFYMRAIDQEIEKARDHDPAMRGLLPVRHETPGGNAKEAM